MKHHGTLTISLLMLALSGCGDLIEFEADMAVFPDNTVTRKTRFIVGEDKSRRELEDQYDLPSGGTWKTGARARRKSGGKAYDEPTIIYEARGQYLPGSSIAPDYVRKAISSERRSRNEPRLATRNYFFVKTYDYEERFADIVTRESFERTARGIYTKVADRGAQYLAQERKDGMTAAEARLAISSAFDPLLQNLMNTLQRNGPLAALEELGPQLKPRQVAERLIEVLPPEAGQDVDVWRKAISNAYWKALQATAEEFRNLDGIFGVYLYGFCFLSCNEYRFNVALSLPGTLTGSNATEQVGNRLIWTFASNDFLYENHVLRASSRLVFWERIAGASVVLVAIAMALQFSRLRRKRARSDSSQL